ncbi:hypothetical protein CANARDRAFT_22110 [[Candida] arabinofermentans NRRL YB-2248]|uniref:AMP-dependent synthetase/ligase domain-containing protein n=1 Tax=[Candida] arabinofermentans NRRL YB-2248 TaxID=983967 RepID=A0A1E4T399_9ASCO|nr:hypothetical protein CANARDRAFT_22110 [[Candida] arabinofermentans NRRL YB-2248]
MSTIQNVIKLSDKTALVVPDLNLSITYNHLNAIVYHLQSMFNNPVSPLFNKGSKRQLKIATSMPNGLEFISSFLSITTTGNIISPLNPSLTKNEISNFLIDLQADAIIVPRYAHLKYNSDLILAIKEVVKPLIVEIWYDSARKLLQFEIFSNNNLTSIYNSIIDKPNIPPYDSNEHLIGSGAKDDIALILFTSGTTGKPKKVGLTHSNLTCSQLNIIRSYKLRSNDINYLIMPLFHIHGLQILFSSLSSNGCVIIPNKFSARKFYPDFKKYQFNWFSAVPTMHLILLNLNIPNDIKGKLRFMRSCSSALSPTILEKLENKFGCPVVEAYGMTEASHQVTSNNLPFHGKIKRMPGTVGIPQGSVEIMIINSNSSSTTTTIEKLEHDQIGEVAVSGDNLTLGYINNDDANRASFFTYLGKVFFKTGDLGTIDNEGRLTLKGRMKEIINRGGEKISPIEIDYILSSNDKIKEVVTFGAPDLKYGQIVQCALVLQDNVNGDENEFKNWLVGKIASFKIPDKFYIVKELPKSATGKIQRRTMSEIFSSKSKV